MKRFMLFLVLAFAGPVFAQDATLTVPVTRNSEAKYVIKRLEITQFQVTFDIAVQDSGNNEIRAFTSIVPDAAHPTATVANFMTALDTARSGETAGILRRMQFRALGYLFDLSYFPSSTLNP